MTTLIPAGGMPAQQTTPVVAGGVTCPLCHTVAATMTEAMLAAGADWTCATCDQRWDATRLATVAAYARFVADRERPLPV